jgi:hypothetical protein
MGTESKPTRKPGKPAMPDKNETALTEDQLKEVSGGKGMIDIMSIQWGASPSLNTGTGGGGRETQPPSVPLTIKP